MKRSIEIEFGAAPLPARWNAIGMLIAGSVLLAITGFGIYGLIYLRFYDDSAVPDPEAMKLAIFMTAIPGILSLLFLTVGGLIFKRSRKVTDADLVASGGMTSSLTTPDGRTKTKSSSALPLLKWVGRVLLSLGLALIVGGIYVLLFSTYPDKLGLPAYLFGVGTYVGLLGWFFIWYRRRILRAQQSMKMDRNN